MRRKDNAMLNVTEKAVMLLKAAKAARGAGDAGIRIQRGVDPNQSGMLTIGINWRGYWPPLFLARRGG
jgi:hypothetical protein